MKAFGGVNAGKPPNPAFGGKKMKFPRKQFAGLSDDAQDGPQFQSMPVITGWQVQWKNAPPFVPLSEHEAEDQHARAVKDAVEARRRHLEEKRERIAEACQDWTQVPYASCRMLYAKFGLTLS